MAWHNKPKYPNFFFCHVYIQKASECICINTLELEYNKPTNDLCSQQSFRSACLIRGLLSAWRVGSLATHKAHSKDSIKTVGLHRLIWVSTGRQVILLVLSCCCSFYIEFTIMIFFPCWMTASSYRRSLAPHHLQNCRRHYHHHHRYLLCLAVTNMNTWSINFKKFNSRKCNYCQV